MNLKDLNNGRLAGLDLAIRIAAETGGSAEDVIKALEKERNFRSQTKININVTAKELDKAADAVKSMCFDTYTTMGMWTLHNPPFNFGEKRCQRFQDHFEKHTKCLTAGLIEWPDITKQIKEEMGLVIEIRYND